MSDSGGDETTPATRRGDGPEGAHAAGGNGQGLFTTAPDATGATGPTSGRPGAAGQGADDLTVPAIRTAQPADQAAPPADDRLVIGLAHGPTLADVTAEEALAPREVVRIGADVARLLAQLHDRGHAHGAVTAANIVLPPGGRAQLVNVMASGTRAVTQTGIGLNWPADDVHDLGAVLIRALAGPGGGGIPEDTPRTLRRVLTAATETDPEQRPTARQVADMLGWAVRDQPPAPPESGGSTKWIFVAAGVLIVLLALIGYGVLRDDPTQTAAPGTTSTPAAPPTTAVAAPTSAEPPPTPTPSPSPTASVPEPPLLPSGFPTALPTSLPTSLPDLPELPPAAQGVAQGLWDQFTTWLGEQWDDFTSWLGGLV